jgi:hypothetical protein
MKTKSLGEPMLIVWSGFAETTGRVFILAIPEAHD